MGNIIRVIMLGSKPEVTYFIRLTRMIIWESMGKPCSCMQFIKAVFLLQVTQESVSGTASHMHASERAMKSKVRMIKSLSP